MIANNVSEKHIIEYSTHARLSRIHEPAFLDIKFFRHFYHVIWLENHQNQVYLFIGHLVNGNNCIKGREELM